MSVKYRKTTGASARSLRACAAVAIMFLFVFAYTAGSAWSFETQVPADNRVLRNHSFSSLNTPPSSAEDPCLPLLQSIRHTNPISAADETRRDAGKVAALGLVFGVRFALGPKEIAGSGKAGSRFSPYIGVPGSGNMQVLAVSAYRQCKREEALNGLSDWRWKR